MINSKRIIITPGEPAGIGPDIVIALSQEEHSVELVICADPDILKSRAKQLGVPLRLNLYRLEDPPKPRSAGELTVLPIKATDYVVAGQLNVNNSHYVIDTLYRACIGCLNGEFAALITGPIHKGIINDSGIPFTGHTEYFSQLSKCKRVVMMLATDSLRVALVTTHLPLIKVPSAITPFLLKEVIAIIAHDLQKKFGIFYPCIYVCGLNPHSGEDGYLGREEIEVIIPSLDALRIEGYNLVGPLPADTIFQPKFIKQADIILAMYHDQGLPVIKYCGFSRTINVTLGLPFIRISVGHGTAIELAGSGKAEATSIKTALNLATYMINHHNA